MELDSGNNGNNRYWMMFVLTSIYLNGELGHYLIGVVSREMAQELHYGSMSCQPASAEVSVQFCEQANSSETCATLGPPPTQPGNTSCQWDYSGLGMDYQLLAGPSFMGVFTVAGVIWGVLADKFNRVFLLGISSIVFSTALCVTALSTSFWHLVASRVLLGIGVSGCSPLAAGMICDSFSQSERGKAMSVYNCGMYVGYGLSYAIGIYITALNLFGLSWRSTFLLCGAPGFILAVLLITTVKNPKSSSRPEENEEEAKAQKEASYSAYESLHSISVNINRREYQDIEEGERSPLLVNSNNSNSNSDSGSWKSPWLACPKLVIILLISAACLRRSAGYTLRYNSALYFQAYYPDYDVGWWLTGIYCVGGLGGSLLGGVVSDKLVNRLGVSARAVVLAVGQLIATPFGFGFLYLDPPYAFIPQSIGYLFGAMWFGALFTILVELVPASIRSSAFGVAFFVMENVGGNFPVIVEYLTSLIDYRTALVIMYPGELLASSFLFFLCYMCLSRR